MMAAQGAHLTSTTLDEGDPPSIFEVLAQESLILALRPALQHLLRVLAENNPSRYGRMYAYSEELYLGLHLVLENYYLKHHSASFSENFYGIKRVAAKASLPEDYSEQCASVGGTGSAVDESDDDRTILYGSLPALHRTKSLLCLVFVPYLKSKCDHWYESLNERQHYPQTSQQMWKKRLCQAFLGIYPVLHFLYESVMLVTQLAYVFRRSAVHSPLLTWAGVVLRNLTEEDTSSTYRAKGMSFRDKSWLECLRMLSSRVVGGLALGLSSALSVGVFFLQFLEWWYASDQRATTLTSLPTPPPPPPLKDATVPRLHTVCPLCQRVRTNDTALSVSGYVFCYGCISGFVKEKNCCPVTGYPANTDQLIRLYMLDS